MSSTTSSGSFAFFIYGYSPTKASKTTGCGSAKTATTNGPNREEADNPEANGIERKLRTRRTSTPGQSDQEDSQRGNLGGARRTSM